MEKVLCQSNLAEDFLLINVSKPGFSDQDPWTLYTCPVCPPRTLFT